jgi:hypothetical protein
MKSVSFIKIDQSQRLKIFVKAKKNCEVTLRFDY